VLFIALRPTQWIKNSFVFAGLVFTGNVTNVPYLRLSLVGFAIFCALASGQYLLNDVKDRKEDRQHPEKSRRPVASGRLTPAFATSWGVILIAGALAAAWWAEPHSGATWVRQHAFFLSTLSYLILTLAYTAGLKHVVILDLFLLASYFVIRAVAGALIIDVKISPWLLICTTLLALFLGLGKRRHELVLLSENAGLHRRSLEDYTLPFIDQLLSIVTAATLVAYALYAFSSETAAVHHGMLVTTPFVMYGLFRYLYLIHVKGKGGSPDKTLLGDAPSIVNFALWTLTILAIFRWGN
jgi:4-hydroxybenzoate polyprenyltransferase